MSPSPTDVGADIANASNPTLLRANSLDGVLIPLPMLSLSEDGKPDNGPSRTLTQRPKSAGPVPLLGARPGSKPAGLPPPPRGAAGSSPSETKPSRPYFFGDAVRHRTYYPAASIPTTFHEKKSPSPSKPPTSILRRRKAPLAPLSEMSCDGTAGMASTTTPPSLDEGDINTTSSPGSLQEIHTPCLPPEIPTLASPASIKSLHSHRSVDGEGTDGIGESEYKLDRLSDVPKILTRNKCKMTRPQSDTTVAKKEEGHSRPGRDSIGTASRESSSGSNVSRHTSLECLANNKRIVFDPHIIVFEFRVTDYERKGGMKWWTEEELTQFKSEAIHRIRLRSTRVIPTGTGRALTVCTKDARVSGGSVMFNHPALGCDDEYDPESPKLMKSPTKIASPQNKAAANEIKKILVVDPHQIFLALFTKSLKHMIPHASVSTARSAEEAMARIEAAQRAFPLNDGGATHGFDIIIVEERLWSSSSTQQQPGGGGRRCSSPTHDDDGSASSTQAAGDDLVQRRGDKNSGSALIRYLAESQHELDRSVGGSTSRRSLLIGVSARVALDRKKLEKSGADCVWGKPPPEMNSALKNELLKLLLKKRNRT